jgi:large subunit ribosomal protein L9
MASAMEVILLERVDSLGNMGEKVRVKPGYARNFLLPQGKALRATEKNVAYFESQKAALEKLNAEKRGEAEKASKKIEGIKIVLIRHASEAGQLYGSVAGRDIAEAINEGGKHNVGRNQVTLNTAIKTLGLFPVTVSLHPEVKVEVTVNVARSQEEAKIQEKTGKALVAQTRAEEAAEAAKADARALFLEDDALKSEQETEAAEAAESAEDEAERAAKKATKKPKKAKVAAEGEETAEEEADEE